MPRRREQEGETSRSSPTAKQRGNDGSENASEQGARHGNTMVGQEQQNVLPATEHSSSMTPQETIWWAMSFEELYQEAKSKNFGKTGKKGRKSGRIRIIKWLCEKEGITPYVAPTVDTRLIAPPTSHFTTKDGALSHPEAILRTSDPDL